MTRLKLISWCLLLVGMFVLGACVSAATVPTMPTNTAISNPTPTRTPTPLPTPTTTAQPIELGSINVRPTAAPPAAQFGAPCGVVDYFDFPLDPPDGETVRGGQDFGRYRDRYDGYHTGEDWWYQPGPSLGKLVYSTGVGRVTYAHPHGWGEDLGTLTIQHILPTGHILYSFYGHLDPESLTLRKGECVTRGQMVGRIGRPRSSPHLHFEIRLSLADQPGPGYWPVDPQLGGWKVPSLVIQESRLEIDPAVSWSRATMASHSELLGTLPGGALLMLDDAALTAFALEDGSSTGRLALPDSLLDLLWQPDVQVLVTASRTGQVTASKLTEIPRQEGSSLQQSWSVELASLRSPHLVDLGMGAIALESGGSWNAFDGGGSFLWRHELIGEMLDSIRINQGTLIATSGDSPDVWTLSQEGARGWETGKSGRLSRVGDRIYLLARDGLYLLDTQANQVLLLHSWSSAYLESIQVIGLPDGNLLLSLRDLFDQRLMLLTGSGELVWERSFEFLGGARDAQLFAVSDQAYLLAGERLTSSIEYTVFKIGDEIILQPVFRTIMRQEPLAEDWVIPSSEGVLISLAGRVQILLFLEDLG